MRVKHRMLPPLDSDKFYFIAVNALSLIGTGQEIVDNLDDILFTIHEFTPHHTVMIAIGSVPRDSRTMPLNHIEFVLN